MKYKLGEIVHGYKIIDTLTGGGMSEVYLGESLDLNNELEKQLVVIKVISKYMIPHKDNPSEKNLNDQWTKALDEFTLTWAIFDKPHANIAKPIKWDMSENRDTAIIITEFIDGPTLAKLISDQKALTVDRAMFYFRKICSAVKHLHQLHENKTIIHRDLKAENIMLSKDLREIKVIDYGIATIFYDNAFESNEDTIYCTANYTTPDILEIKSNILRGAAAGEAKFIKKLKEIITPQFDYHAMGVILYQMLTGNFPFMEIDRETDADKIRKWLNFDLPVISTMINNVPNSIENIIFRLTASKEEDKKHRYKDIDEIIEDVSKWDSQEERNKPLIKAIEKRKFQQAQAFDLDAYKQREKFSVKWWFFILVNTSILIAIITIVIIIILMV